MNETPDLFEVPRRRDPAIAPVRKGGTRKLHAGHFAFMRAVVQGLDLKQSWQRYLRLEGEATDQRTVRATIAWIRDEFAAAARREARFGTARLVLIDASRVPEASVSLPSLDSFAAERDLGDFSQAEQLALYEAAFGRATQRERRRSRLIERQLQALHWLELRVAEPPRAADPIGAWLNPRLAAPLEAARVQTLAHLAEYINGRGARWHRGLRGLGPTKAQRIVDWLAAHEASTGVRLGTHTALVPRTLSVAQREAIVAPATGVHPLEKFRVPPALDGRTGTWRRPQAECRIPADTDRAAIDVWLAGKPTAHTRRAYRKEAERFLLWAVLAQGRALSSIAPADCVAYRAFIADPQPAARWCGPRSVGRWSPAWRPFEGPLSPAAQRQALTILKNLYGFLVDAGYLAGNPWTALDGALHRSAAPARPVRPPTLDGTRSFSEEQWAWLDAHAERLGDHGANRRLAFALRLLHATGLRLSEAVSATLADLRRLPGSADALPSWALQVSGPRARVLPLPPKLVEQLDAYLRSRGLTLAAGAAPLAPGEPAAFLLGRASDARERAPHLPQHAAYEPQAGIAAPTLYRQLKHFFASAADALREARGDAAGAEHLARASTHWLRHTHARHMLARGLPIELAQHQLGHASLATTAAYVTPDLSRRVAALQRVWAHPQTLPDQDRVIADAARQPPPPAP